MKVVHLSYAIVTEFTDPQHWLRRIDFFVALLEEMARHAEVVSIHCIGCEGEFSRNGVKYFFFKPQGLERYLPARLNRKVASLKPDVIVCHGFHYPGKLAMLRSSSGKQPLIFVQHHSEKPLGHYKRYVQTWIDRFVTGYFFPSSEQAEGWIRLSQIRSIKKVYEVMEVPSVFQVIDRSPAVTFTKVDGNPTFLWVGRLEENKDPMTLINGFVSFAINNPDARLYVIYQQNDMLREVEVLITASSCANQIVLVGRVPHNDLLFWFNSADFFVSTSHDEGMGISLAEAMSCGCIPIVTRIPSFRKMIPPQLHPYMFDPGDATALSDSLMRSSALSLPAMKKLILQQSADILSAEAISSRMLSVFEHCLSSVHHD